MTRTLTRRTVLKTAAATTTALAMPFVHGAHAAGSLKVGFWDHWVPGANDVMSKICHEWAEKEKVDIQIDFITTVGDKLILTAAAEAQARSGHDILAIQTWYAVGHADVLEPMDDLVKQLEQQNGKVTAGAEYLGTNDGHWVAVPANVGCQTKPPCARIDLMKQLCGIDVQKMYPAGGPPDKELADNWTWDTFLDAAGKAAKGGSPFGMPMGQVATDATDWVGAVFASHGAFLMDKDGNITVKTDQVKQVLEWFKKAVPLFPADTFAWDDAGNNKWLVSGKGALIMNPPSAWAVAVRDMPKIAEQLWTFASPKGPKGRYEPSQPWFWGTWSFSPNKAAAKSLLTHLSSRESAEKFVAASHGYDLPPWANLLDFKTWAEEGPPKGTLYSYPPRYPDQIVSIACAPAPKKIANQIYSQATMTKMIAHCTQQGQSIDQAIAWAEQEIEGFMRS
ncbi:MAG: extracellular solute-binding protein [Alphaproteobacteria bacterium]|nr:extracellular solute-binding protein [Alphaproteobacteria bacterium]